MTLQTQSLYCNCLLWAPSVKYLELGAPIPILLMLLVEESILPFQVSIVLFTNPFSSTSWVASWDDFYPLITLSSGIKTSTFSLQGSQSVIFGILSTGIPHVFVNKQPILLDFNISIRIYSTPLYTFPFGGGDIPTFNPFVWIKSTLSSVMHLGNCTLS